MDDLNKLFEENRDSWNKRTPVHFNSQFYNNNDFIEGKNSLNDIELNDLGSVEGKSLLHLQCHFGQDTLSFNRLGANVVGVDLSDASIESANKLREMSGLKGEFVRSNIYDLKDNLNGQFDIVFTSYGAIGWLPDLDKWASIISHFLKPGGVFYIAEFHPVVWMFDYSFEKVEYPYLKSDVISEDLNSTYADRDVKLEIRDNGWNHGLSEVINSLIDSGMEIEFVKEFDYSPYDIFEESSEPQKGKYMVKGLEYKLPLVFSIRAVKK